MSQDRNKKALLSSLLGISVLSKVISLADSTDNAELGLSETVSCSKDVSFDTAIDSKDSKISAELLSETPKLFFFPIISLLYNIERQK